MRKGEYIRFYSQGSKDDWDMTEKQYKKLVQHYGQIAKITSNDITGTGYFDIKFEDGYKIKSADLHFSMPIAKDNRIKVTGPGHKNIALYSAKRKDFGGVFG